MIEFENVTKEYEDGTRAVGDLSFIAQSGKITVLVGPSGCGKTTTLRMVNRLIEPTSGTVLIDGKDILQLDKIELRRKIGYVIQQAGLFDHRTILDNICAVPLLNKPDKSTKAAIKKRAFELMQLVGIDESLAQRYPWQLSGGQKQRVGVARALAADPPFMLLDEPFSAVDPIVRGQLQKEFLAIQQKLAKTIIMVTHDVNEALTMGDQIVVLKEGGHIAQIGAPLEILENPRDDFVADFIGSSRGYYALNFESITEAELETVATERQSNKDSNLGDSQEPRLILDDDARPLGWWHGGELLSAPTVELETGNKRAVLDAALASATGRAVIVRSDGTYAGVLTGERVVAHR